jgi:uncharacterized protein YcfJ
MSKMMMIGSMLGAAAITALGAVATNYNSQKDSQPQWVEIVGSKALTETSTEPQQQCTTKKIAKTAPVQDQHEIAGTVIGAVVGGVLGNQVGGGSGKKLATVAGAAAGGYAGKQVQEDMQRKDVSYQEQQVCKTVQKTVEKTIGYEVRYLHDGELKTTQVSQKPTGRMLLQDGKLMAVEPASS